MKKYTCLACRAALKSPLALTRHIRDCKSGKLTRKNQKAVCPECGKVMKNWTGLGSHRFRSHGVLGQSRKSCNKRSLKKVAVVKGAKAPPAHGDGIVGQALQEAAKCRTEANRLLEKAGKLEGLAKELQGVLA